MTSTEKTAEEIINFWFDDDVQKLWFNSSDEFDQKIQILFESTYNNAVDGLLKSWEKTPQGSLALIILFDQFPLNMYRGDKKGFETESLSREVAQRAIDNGFDQELPSAQKAFMYLPFMHSENLQDQQKSVSFFEAASLENNLRFAKHHLDIIRRFGRFPHRNKILGRENTEEEIEYLNSDSAFHG